MADGDDARRVAIDPDVVDGVGADVVALADDLRRSLAAADVDLARPAPAGFLASAAGAELWASRGAEFDRTATAAAVLGHNLGIAAARWRDADAAVAADVAARMGR